ncbi:MAG: hypothetical protein ACRDJF_12870 [Actinomycetota bacterium]
MPGDAGDWPRPVVDLVVADMDDVSVPCLLDTGAINTLLPRWVADAAGIMPTNAPSHPLVVGGTRTETTFLITQLEAAGNRWEAEVGFCDPWPYVWGLAGQLSFLRFFTVTIRATDFEFELEPVLI